MPTARSGEVETSVEKSTPYTCLIRSVRVCANWASLSPPVGAAIAREPNYLNLAPDADILLDVRKECFLSRMQPTDQGLYPTVMGTIPVGRIAWEVAPRCAPFLVTPRRTFRDKFAGNFITSI
jgi:hypothetical protein